MGNKASIILFITGLFFIIYSLLKGEAKAGIFIIFPFIYGNGLFLILGIILIFISFIFLIFSFPHKIMEEKFEPVESKIEKKAGGIIFIGPIPIIIASDQKIALILIILSIIIISTIFLLIFI